MAEQRVVTTVEELEQLVGQELSVSDWFEVTQAHVDAFADATGDHQWIHVDAERAQGGPFGGTIAHGFWTLASSYLYGHGEGGVQVRLPVRMGINYGLNRVRFPAPVPVGRRIRARRRLLSVEEVQPGVLQQVTEITVEVEGGARPAMVAEQVGRTYLEQ